MLFSSWEVKRKSACVADDPGSVDGPKLKNNIPVGLKKRTFWWLWSNCGSWLCRVGGMDCYVLFQVCQTTASSCEPPSVLQVVPGIRAGKGKIECVS